MPDVVISFLDGEVLYAETPDITFDLPIIEAEVRSVDPNSERALFPLSAIRQLLVGNASEAPDGETVATWDRAAFHFADGQVLRASIAPDAFLGRHGGVWTIVEPGDDEQRTMAIPYSALKGIYRIREWDGRPVSQRGGRMPGIEQLARVLAEREEPSLPNPSSHQPLLKRVRRKRRSPSN